MMKIIGINGTPHRKVGNTTLMMNELFEGVKDVEASCELEMVFLADKEIAYCRGCALCLIKGKCPQDDDMPGLIESIKAADGIVLGSPVYFLHVTAQMKTFMDRTIALAHRPQLQGKYGAAVSPSAGWGDPDVARYMSEYLEGLGVQSAGVVHGIAIAPGQFLDKDVLFAHARRVGRELASAIKEKRNYPINSSVRNFHRFMGDLIIEHKDLFKEDFRYWKEKGMFTGRILD